MLIEPPWRHLPPRPRILRLTLRRRVLLCVGRMLPLLFLVRLLLLLLKQPPSDLLRVDSAALFARPRNVGVLAVVVHMHRTKQDPAPRAAKGRLALASHAKLADPRVRALRPMHIHTIAAYDRVATLAPSGGRQVAHRAPFVPTKHTFLLLILFLSRFFIRKS